MAFPDLPVVTLPDPATRTETDGASFRSKLIAIFTPWKAEIEGLRTKVGYANSTDASSLDYRLSRVDENVQAGNYTLTLTDAGKVVAMNVASGNTLTVPPNSAVALPIGTVIEAFQYGAGQTTITAGSGVTLRSVGAKLKLTSQYSSASLRKRATDEWVVAGDLSA